MVDNLSKESKLLLDLVANTLFDAGLPIDLRGVDWESLFAEARKQTVLALAFDALPPDAVTYNEEVYTRWKQGVMANIQKNIRQLCANAAVEGIFAEAGLPMCTIKGFASAYYYGGKRHLRQMGDVDFVVPKEYLEKSKKLMLEHGFTLTDNSEEHDFHLAFRKGSQLYEMHKGVVSLLEGEMQTQAYLAEIFSKAVQVDLEWERLTIPDAFSHGLIMLLHMKRHMLGGGGVGLRHLCDWAVLVNAVSNDEWIALFQEKLQKINLWRFAQALGKASALFLKIENKEWFAEMDNQTAEELLADMLLCGNFGKTDRQRYQEAFFLNKIDQAGKKRRWRHLHRLTDKVYLWKPVYKQKKFLLPVGYLAYIWRIVLLTASGKKHIDWSGLRKRGKNRNHLYSKLFR